jgi:hypothetical protein
MGDHGTHIARIVQMLFAKLKGKNQYSGTSCTISGCRGTGYGGIVAYRLAARQRLWNKQRDNSCCWAAVTAPMDWLESGVFCAIRAEGFISGTKLTQDLLRKARTDRGPVYSAE